MPTYKLPRAYRDMLAKAGAKGGKAAAESMTPKERQERAAKAGKAAALKRKG